MTLVATQSQNQKHHPEWTNVYNRTHVRWTTHNPQGLSLKDTDMARFCDQAAQSLGEQWPDPQPEMRIEAGKVVGEGCGC
jgi:4a-hydroxytetrahydrobiopterin dehydratase